MNPLIYSFILQFASLYNISPDVVKAVMRVESNFNVKAQGTSGEIGLMQIMPSNFSAIPKKELYDPALNIALGVALLAEAKKSCAHKKNYEYVLCYNLGPQGAKKIKYPNKHTYYKKVMRALEYVRSEQRLR